MALLCVLIISNNVLNLSRAVISWCRGFLKQPFCTAAGGGAAAGAGGGTRSGQGGF